MGCARVEHDRGLLSQLLPNMSLSLGLQLKNDKNLKSKIEKLFKKFAFCKIWLIKNVFNF